MTVCEGKESRRNIDRSKNGFKDSFMTGAVENSKLFWDEMYGMLRGKAQKQDDLCNVFCNKI
jgi:hypothetical protein